MASTTTDTATDLTLILPDVVGSLATAMAVFRKAGVNIRGHGAFPAWAGEGILHLILEDTQAGIGALREAGIEVREERQVLVVGLAHRPGAFADVLERIAAAGVNIDLTYSLADGHVVLGVNDLQRTRLAVMVADASASTDTPAPR